MENQSANQNPEPNKENISVKPTGQPATGQYTDISLTNLVGLHIHQINSERQAIWQRYTAMLIANSILFGVSMNGQKSAMATLFITFLGIAICYFWWKITRIGWDVFVARWKVTLEFQWENLPEIAHPSKESLAYIEKYKGDIIADIAQWVIYLFMVGYIFFCIHSFFQ